MSIIEAVWQPQPEPEVVAAKTNGVAAGTKPAETVALSETTDTPSSTAAAPANPMAGAVEETPEVVVLPRRNVEPTGVNHMVGAVEPTPDVRVVPHPVLDGVNHMKGAVNPAPNGRFQPDPVSPGPDSDAVVDKLADATEAAPVDSKPAS